MSEYGDVGQIDLPIRWQALGWAIGLATAGGIVAYMVYEGLTHPAQHYSSTPCQFHSTPFYAR